MQTENLFEGKTTTEIKQLLLDNSHEVVTETYIKHLTDDELIGKKDSLADTSIELSQLQDEKKDLTASINEKMKPLKDEVSSLLKCIKTKSEERHGNLYKFIDFEKRTATFYDETGTLIYSRKTKPDETQTKIAMLTKTA